MLNGLMGKKLGMTQIFNDEGKWVPVTVVEAGPCRVVQIKTLENDGYAAAQLSFGEIKLKSVTRPLAGHFKKSNVAPSRYVREFRGDLGDVSVGQVINAGIFKKGDGVEVTGISKGKGFQGVMKRHHYSGGPATHGSMFHRAPGSIGASSFPSRVWPGKGLPGHMGSEQVTVQGLRVVEVRPEENLVFIRGAVPGSKGTLLVIHRSVRGNENG